VYNHLDMTELHVDELKEFASVIPPYRASYLAARDLEQVTLTEAAQLLDELATMLEIYIRERETRQEFKVKRDFWTLRSVRAEEALDNIYEEGNIDLTFFGQLLLHVSWDSDWNGPVRPLGKSDQQIFEDALALAEYLVSTGEFWAGQGIRHDDGEFENVIFDDLDCFRQLVRQQFADRPQWMDNLDLAYATWMLKKLPPREKRPPIPDNIKALFGDAR
jgi:hypothetical protein